MSRKQKTTTEGEMPLDLQCPPAGVTVINTTEWQVDTVPNQVTYHALPSTLVRKVDEFRGLTISPPQIDPYGRKSFRYTYSVPGKEFTIEATPSLALDIAYAYADAASLTEVKLTGIGQVAK